MLNFLKLAGLVITLFTLCMLGVYMFKKPLPALDESIPLLETPVDRIATVRIRRYDGKRKQLALFDRQERLLEEYNFGRSNSKVLNQYAGALRTRSVVHYHSDSSPGGYSTVTIYDYRYDQRDRLVGEEQRGEKWKRQIEYAYAPNGDTIRTIRREEPVIKRLDYVIPSIDRWERNHRQQLVRHYSFYAIQASHEALPDTLWHFSQRYAYAPDGRRTMAWFDYMYLGRFYQAAGPDTIYYRYDTKGHLIGETHRYTTSMTNKREIDTTKLKRPDRRSIRVDRKRFFNGESPYLPSNDQTHQVRYQYEPFIPAKHIPLSIPSLDELNE